MIWYRACTYSFKIEEVEVLEETEKRLILIMPGIWDKKQYEKKVHKIAASEAYFPTRAEAFDWKKGKIEKEIAYEEKRLNGLKKDLADFIAQNTVSDKKED